METATGHGKKAKDTKSTNEKDGKYIKKESYR